MGKREPLFPGGFRSNGHRGGKKKGCPLFVVAFILWLVGLILAGLTGVATLAYYV